MAYVSQQNLLNDETGEPVRHPQVNEYFDWMRTNEVAEVFEVPLNLVLDRSKVVSQHFLVNQNRHRVFGLSYQDHFIWGMTAQIIQALQKHLSLPRQ